jgi:hypothetical protein
MRFISITKEELRNRKTDILRDIIYYNFIHLAKQTDLKHTKLELDRLLNSDTVVFYLCLDDNNKIHILKNEEFYCDYEEQDKSECR